MLNKCSERERERARQARALLDVARALATTYNVVTLAQMYARFDEHDDTRAYARAYLVALRLKSRDASKYVDATFVCSACNRVAFVSRTAFDIMKAENDDIIVERDADDSLDYCTLCACSLDDDDIRARKLTDNERKTRADFADERITL